MRYFNCRLSFSFSFFFILCLFVFFNNNNNNHGVQAQSYGTTCNEAGNLTGIVGAGFAGLIDTPYKKEWWKSSNTGICTRTYDQLLSYQTWAWFLINAGTGTNLYFSTETSDGTGADAGSGTTVDTVVWTSTDCSTKADCNDDDSVGNFKSQLTVTSASGTLRVAIGQYATSMTNADDYNGKTYVVQYCVSSCAACSTLSGQLFPPNKGTYYTTATTSASITVPTCGTIYMPNYYVFTAHSNGTVFASTCVTDGAIKSIGSRTTAIAVFTSCGSAPIACGTLLTGCTSSAKVTFNVVQGTTYTIAIGVTTSGSYSGDSGRPVFSFTCAAGTYDNDSNQNTACVPCTAINNCSNVTCTTAANSVCNKCNSGFYLSGNTCLSCTSINNCNSVTCTTSSNSVCTNCNSGFYLSGGACPSCTAVPNCNSTLTCSDSTNSVCTSCDSGYTLQSNACVLLTLSTVQTTTTTIVTETETAVSTTEAAAATTTLAIASTVTPTSSHHSSSSSHPSSTLHSSTIRASSSSHSPSPSPSPSPTSSSTLDSVLSPNNSGGGSAIGPAIGGAVGGVLVLLLLILLIVRRKRKSNKKDIPPAISQPRRVRGSKDEEVNSIPMQSVAVSTFSRASQDSYNSGNLSGKASQVGLLNNIDHNINNNADSNTYANASSPDNEDDYSALATVTNKNHATTYTNIATAAGPNNNNNNNNNNRVNSMFDEGLTYATPIFSEPPPVPRNTQNLRTNNVFVSSIVMHSTVYPPYCNRRDLEILQLIGSGEFAAVHFGKMPEEWRVDSIQNNATIGQAKPSLPPKPIASKQKMTAPCAVKLLKSDADEKAETDFIEEGKIMMEINHPGIVKAYAIFTETAPFLTVLELLQYGDLLHLLQNCSSTNLTLHPYEFIHIILQISSAMEYLASVPIVHRDLAARNILVGSNLVVKISDFGLSRQMEEKNYYRMESEAKLPARWMAPESLNFKRFSTASDVWSFGIVCWEIYSYGGFPYGTIPNRELHDYLESNHRLTCPPGCPNQVFNLVLQCWAWDEYSRPTFTIISNYFRSQPLDTRAVRDIGAILSNQYV